LGNASAIAIAVMGLLAMISGIVIWFYKRGGQERSFADALNENTKSNREVAAELRDFKGETLNQLRDHDWRLKIIEKELGK
jgi:hypothetical protein